ncbi:hypothetical protein [Achromobacter phage shaaii_LB5]|nr:hypothetical protein [Achromobacter phage shaaii_LB5]
MRLDANEMANYGRFKQELALNADVYLDGMPVVDVITADTKKGYVIRYNGQQSKDEFEIETIHGNVIIVDRRTGRSWGKYWGTKID